MQHRKAATPKRGVWLLGEMVMVVKGWEGIQQVPDLCEGPSEPALLGSLRDAHRWDVLALQMRGFGMGPYT